MHGRNIWSASANPFFLHQILVELFGQIMSILDVIVFSLDRLFGSMFCYLDSLVSVCIPSITNEHTLGQSGLGGNEGLTIMWPFWIWDCSSPARAQHIYACMIYSRRSILRKRAGLKETKMSHLRAKILLGAVQPNLMSVVSQRISRRVVSVWINECFLCITGHRGAFGPGKGINHHHKCPFSSPSHCVYVQTVSSQRILCRTSSSTNTGSLHGKYCSLLLPVMFPFLPLPTTVLPSWLHAWSH